ncbi:glutamate receptor 2-like isoform X2 [Actinia tenebrosa]|uniref:Glutamate receptor 2-like isoform X2 n=1 Tax=Actinia tenebrosa TaxID=6105 RepID=A0A6P8HWT4_ACTTE|nr:glutamate receptor 2-like isoform X2 [Actinia tenebrosa]
MAFLFLLYLFFCVCTEPVKTQSTKRILIGGIFRNISNAESDYEGFRTAIDYINEVEKQKNSMIRFEGIVEFTDSDEDLDNVLKAISLVDRGAVAIIGPNEVIHIEAIQRLCPQLRTPQLAPFASGLTQSFNPCDFEYILRMSPSDDLLCNVAADVVKYFKWTKVAVLASRDNEGREALGSFRDFLEDRRIKLLQSELFIVDPDDNTMHHEIRRVLDSILKAEARIIVVRCRSSVIRKVLQEAENKDMLKEYAWIWLVNNFEKEHLFPGGQMSHELKGLIGVRQAIGHGPLGEAINEYYYKNRRIAITKPSVGRIIDSVLVVAKAVRNALQDGFQISSDKRSGRICNKSMDIVDDGGQGAILSSYLRQVTMYGFMGNISFDKGAQKSGIYDVVNFHDNSITKIGLWNTNEKLKMFKNKTIIWNSDSSYVPRDSINTLKNKILTVVTSMSSPFTMLKLDNVTGGVRGRPEFEGAAIDILDKLKEALHFDYVIYKSPDGTVGNFNSRTGRWNGAIGELLNETADLAIGPITISSRRSKVVVFTQPYMTTGLGVIMATEEGDPSFFGFLKPFSVHLWIVIIGAVLGMAVVSFVFSLLSPYGFYGRCVQSTSNEVKASHLETQYNLSLLNSIWSSTAYYLGQGPDGLHPISASGRAAIAVWWFCITILTSTYTANLAAYLTTNRMQTPIAHVNDLSEQNEIDYGLIENSQTQRFFEDSRLSRYLIMWEYMKLRRALVSNTSSGIQRVLKGKYAFIHDAPVLQYQARKNYCGHIKLIGGFDEKTIGKMSYGFALPKGSPYRLLINIELLKLQQKGVIKKIIKKWMIDKTPCSLLDDADLHEESKTDAYRMGLMNMLGVFIFMLAGVVIGLIFLIIEWWAAAVGDSKRAMRHLPFMRAIQNRLSSFFKHVKNPETKKLDLSHPRSATRSTQTKNPSEKTSMHYDHLHDRYRPVTQAIAPSKATGVPRKLVKGMRANKPRPKLQSMVVSPSMKATKRWPSTEL